MPSLWEGFGLVLIEALYCMNKVVSTDCPGSPRELLSGVNNAMLSKNNDYNDLKNKIIKMISKNIYSNRLIKKKVRLKFSLENHINSYNKIISQL